MNDEEIIECLKKIIIKGARIGEICDESGVSRGTIQNILRGKGPLSFVVRMRLEDYCKKSLNLVK